MTKKQFNKEYYEISNRYDAMLSGYSSMPCDQLYAINKAYHEELEALYIKYGVVECSTLYT